MEAPGVYDPRRFSVIMSDMSSNGFLDILDQAKQEVDILWRFIDPSTPYIEIHINKKKMPDYARMMFVLSALARGVKHQIVTKEQKEVLLDVFWKLYNKTENILSPTHMQYVDLYGMRFLNTLGEDYSVLTASFSGRGHQDLFTYPVLTYIFVSAYKECLLLRKQYPFATSLQYEAYKVLDWLLRSDEHVSYLPFHFAELSAWNDDSVLAIQKLAYEYIDHCFKGEYLTRPESTTSGVAKCMEDFARRGVTNRFEECEAFLLKRQLIRFKEYIRPDQKKIATHLYTENNDTQYICLDTNAHLLNAYINIHERLLVS